jgi:hypothetical protein
MARKSVKEAVLDTQLIYALAKVNKLSELEELISVPNVAKIDQIGERCFDEGMFEAAKILFTNINNNAKLALCFVALEQFREAVDAATSARLALLRQQALSTPRRLGKAWLSGIDGLAITAVLVVLAIVLPQQLPQFSSGQASDSTNSETVEVLTEEPEPEFYQDLDMLQWLAHEGDARV